MLCKLEKEEKQRHFVLLTNRLLPSGCGGAAKFAEGLAAASVRRRDAKYVFMNAVNSFSNCWFSWTSL